MSTATAYASPNRAWAPAPARRPATPLRLAAPPSSGRPGTAVYRRRRVAAVLLLVALVLLAVRLGGSMLSTAAAGEPVRSPLVLVAEPGDSYWSLASEVHEGGDLRSTVDALVDANGGRELRAGDRIVVAG